MKSIKKQKGVALFVTLLVISIATILATEMWFNNRIDIAKQMNNRAFLQSEHYSYGMVLWAKDVLKKDFEAQANFDNRGEAWNQSINGIQTEDAMLSGRLTAMDSKFNLNNLLNENGKNLDQIAFFKRLLSHLNMELALADKIIDWMDQGNDPEPMGAEDVLYLSRAPYYRTAGQPLKHISELRLIDGVDDLTYKRLKDYVTVLPRAPQNRLTKININLASTVILRSLIDDLTIQDAIALYNEGNASSQNLNDFFEQNAIKPYFYQENGDELRQQLTRMIDTKSIWFQAQVNVSMDQNYFQKYALLMRNGSSSAVQLWSTTPFE